MLFLILLMGSLLLAGCDDDAAARAGGMGGPPGGGGGGGGGPPPSPVRVANVEMRSVVDQRQIVGSLRAKQRSQVANVEPGQVVAIEFDEAQLVKAGDVLVRLDDRRLQEDLAQIEAQLAVAEAQMLQAQAEADRIRQDLEAREAAAAQAQGAVSALELRQGRTAVAVADAQVNAAEKELAATRTRIERVNVQLADTVVRAPFDGRVLVRAVEVGEYLAPGSTVAELASEGTFEAVLRVPETFSYAFLDQIEPALISIGVDTHGLMLEPSLVRVVPDIDPRSRQYMLIADVASSDPAMPLATGMSVTATVPTQEMAQRLVVPFDALRRDAGGYFVYGIIPGDGGMQMAIPMAVNVDFRVGPDAVLTPDSQVGPGMQVVTEGGERLRPGSPVRPLEANSPAAPAATTTRPAS